MTMTSSIELKSISCKGVKGGVLFQKPSLYAVVSVARGGDRPEQQKKTPVDRSGGENPEWDQTVRLDVGGRDQGRLLKFELKDKGIFRDGAVGRVCVPVRDLDFTGALQHVSYRVETPDGKPNGVLSFSYKIHSPEAMVSPAPPQAVDYYPPPPASAVSYYPPPPPTEPSVSFPAPSLAGYYTPPDPAISYPVPDFGYFSTPDPGYGYPALAPAVGGYYPPPPPAHEVYPPQPAPAVGGYYRPPPHEVYPPQPAVGGYYPPPPKVHEAYPPQPAPACCYPAPHDPYGYRRWDRGLSEYN